MANTEKHEEPSDANPAPHSALVYDLEIVRAVPSRKEPRLDGIEYCAGWQDHQHMGISVIGVYDFFIGHYRVFCADNWGEFLDLCAARDFLVGFNSIPFDNAVIAATLGVNLNALYPEKCYDLLREIWVADGLGPDFVYPTHAGYGLDAVCQANFGSRKTGHGAVAPVLWQQGKIGQVIDYCLNDVRLTCQLFKRAIRGPRILSPVSHRPLFLRPVPAPTAPEAPA